MSRLVKQLLPEWLEAPWAQKAADWRLSLALECWDRCATQWDVEGVGLYAAIALELGDRGGAGRALEQLGRAVDWRLAFQPLRLKAFLEDLASNGLTPCKAPSLDAGYAYLPELVQRAAALAAQGTLQGVLRRRHGAVLLDGPRVVTEGFNHVAEPLQQRRTRVHWATPVRQTSAGNARHREAFHHAWLGHRRLEAWFHHVGFLSPPTA
eukprot:g3703.t1